MGVSYYGCSVCGESVYEEYAASCTNCEKTLCTDCLVNNDIGSQYSHSYGIEFDPEKIDEIAKYLNMKTDDFFAEDGQPYWGDGEIIDDTSIDKKYCPYCAGETIDDEKVLEYILEKYNINKREIWPAITHPYL